MKRSARRDFVKTLGVSTANSSLAVDDGDGTVHFLVTQCKQPNYLRYAHDPTVKVCDPIAAVRLYTDHTTKYFAKVNLSLAADSPALQEHGDYIKDLRASIGRCGSGLVQYERLYRGVELSQIELERMEALGSFYIPSFTSTSVEKDLAYNKNSTLVIRLNPASSQACEITPLLSDFYGDEKEVLLACYSAYHLERIEKVGSHRVIQLYLDDYLSSLSGRW